MHRLLIPSAIMLSIGLAAPVAAQQHDDKDQHAKSYYDKKGKDTHEWNEHEDKAYHVYMGQQHRTYVEFEKEKPAQQQQYFIWRHKNPDTTLFKLEIK